MNFINRTDNTVYLQDIDRHIPFLGEQYQYIDEDSILKSSSFQQLIMMGQIEIIEIDDTRIENNLLRMQQNMAKLRQIASNNKTQNSNNEPNDKTTISQDSKSEIVIKGHFLEGGGYAKCNRNLARGLVDAGYNVKIEVVGGQKNELTENEAKFINSLRGKGTKHAIRIDSMIPSLAHVSSGRYCILFTTVESYTVPDQTVDIANSYHEIWVTSTFCKEVLRQYDVKPPIRVVPNSIDTNHYCLEGDAYKFKPALKDFVFVSVFGWSYRKGYDVLLKSYLEAFSGDDPVTLLIVSKFQGKNSDRIKKDINKFIQDSGHPNPPHIVRCSKSIPEKQMPALYRACDSFVLFSRGEGFGLPFCFKHGTLIQTPYGFKPIEDINICDSIISGSNVTRKVSDKHTNYGTFRFIKIGHLLGWDKIEVTDNHAFLATKPARMKDGRLKKQFKDTSTWEVDWVRAKDLSTDHFLAYPIKQEWPKFNLNIDLMSFNNLWLYDDDKVWSKYSNKSDLKIKLNRNIEVDTDFAKLLGYFVAEGSISSFGNGVEFAFHSDEQNYHEEVKNIIYKKFGINSRIFLNGNKARVVCCSSILATILKSMCGSCAFDKQIPNVIMSSPIEVVKSFLNGYINGDGCSYKYSNIISISTVSETLARQYQKLMLDMGEFCSLILNKRNEWICSIHGFRSSSEKWIEKDERVKKNKETLKIYSNDKYVFMRIKDIECYEDTTTVYNLDVPVDESYISGICIAHNCEASLCGLPVVGTYCSGHSMFLNHDNAYLIDVDRFHKIEPGTMHLHYWDNQKFPAFSDESTIRAAADQMRRCYENPHEAREKNEKLRHHIMSKYSIECLVNRVQANLEHLWSKQ